MYSDKRVGGTSPNRISTHGPKKQEMVNYKISMDDPPAEADIHFLIRSLVSYNGTERVAQAEGEAVKRACRHAYVDTYGFQALGFYQNLDYQVFGVLEGFPPGHMRYFLQKHFD